MTTDASTAYRDPTVLQVEALTAENARLRDALAKRAEHSRWTFVCDEYGDMHAAAFVCLVVIFLAWCALGAVFAAIGIVDSVLRGLLVCAVMSAAWCLAFVRREVTP